MRIVMRYQKERIITALCIMFVCLMVVGCGEKQKNEVNPEVISEATSEPMAEVIPEEVDTLQPYTYTFEEEWWNEYEPKYWKGKIHIFDEYTTQEDAYLSNIEEENRVFVFDSISYITDTFFGKEYKIHSGMDTIYGNYFLSYEERHLFEIKEDRVEERIDQDISDYTLFDHYFVYGVKKDEGLRILDLKSGENYQAVQLTVRKLKSDQESVVLLTKENTFVVLDKQSIEKICEGSFSLESIDDPIEMEEIIEHKKIESINYFDVTNGALYLKVNELQYNEEYQVDIPNEKLLIFSIEDRQILDQFEIREFAIDEDGQIFYTKDGMLFEYLPETMKVILRDKGYGLHIIPWENQLAVYQGIDGPGSYKVFAKERDYIQENYPEAMQYDYVLFSETDEYRSYLVLYDRRNQHIYRVSRQDSTLLYRLSTTAIEYTSIENKDLPWESYLLPYEGTVYVVNDQIESILSNIRYEQEQGYIGENELYIEDNGEFMIFATAIYHEGSFNRKTITAYQFGVHQKGYPYWNNSGFSVECDVVFETILPKEDKSGFTISYVEEGIRKVAEFEIDFQRHEIILVKVQEE